MSSKLRPDYNKIKKLYLLIKRVHRNLSTVSFGVMCIFTILLYFLVWIMVVFMISIDLKAYWWLVLPLIMISLFFWDKYLGYIQCIYQEKYEMCRKDLLIVLNGANKEKLSRLIPDCITNSKTEPKQKINDKFLKFRPTVWVLMENWNFVWWFTLIGGLYIIALLLTGLMNLIIIQMIFKIYFRYIQIRIHCLTLCRRERKPLQSLHSTRW